MTLPELFSPNHLLALGAAACLALAATTTGDAGAQEARTPSAAMQDFHRSGGLLPAVQLPAVQLDVRR